MALVFLQPSVVVNVKKILNDVFEKYPQTVAPFLHHQYHDWLATKPLKGLRVLNHIPLVQNTLLKVACLVAAGADVVVSNHDFIKPDPYALMLLEKENIEYVKELSVLKNTTFDIYLDCCAVAYQTLNAPRIGAVELTASGDALFRQMQISTPIISIDRSFTKQLETIFGLAKSVELAMPALLQQDLTDSRWLVFGFGKIGRGIAYLCEKNKYDVTIVDMSALARHEAMQRNIAALDVMDVSAVQAAIQAADVIVTATGGEDVLRDYPSEWFRGKILANMGAFDEFGPRFEESEVLFAKRPINFSLPDPTPIEYIDAAMYAHNQVALDLLKLPRDAGVHDMQLEFDRSVIDRWCDYHNQSHQLISKWFIL